jgi:hypothetical protein
VGGEEEEEEEVVVVVVVVHRRQARRRRVVRLRIRRRVRELLRLRMVQASQVVAAAAVSLDREDIVAGLGGNLVADWGPLLHLVLVLVFLS